MREKNLQENFNLLGLAIFFNNSSYIIYPKKKRKKRRRRIYGNRGTDLKKCGLHGQKSKGQKIEDIFFRGDI